ncbi:hypothetical protein G6O67_007390 [Ophiocordyceps sinensis]|uniref:Uncharacterized protein n=1 Tax=Ophiocordyceps sinensis TaxID=72228 RepID=A0A8H4LTM9_9HYPO|nr:hypothetical protein G6O67_007390 [Ophiocordyceps sinensis]
MPPEGSHQREESLAPPRGIPRGMPWDEMVADKGLAKVSATIPTIPGEMSTDKHGLWAPPSPRGAFQSFSSCGSGDGHPRQRGSLVCQGFDHGDSHDGLPA